MVQHVNKPQQPSDVTALIVTKETDATRVLSGSREMVARNALIISTEIIVVAMLLFFTRIYYRSYYYEMCLCFGRYVDIKLRYFLYCWSTLSLKYYGG